MPPGLPDFTNTAVFWLTALVVFTVVVLRYFLVSGVFYLVFYVWQPAKWKRSKIASRDYPSGQFRQEIVRSIISSLIFGISGALLAWLWQKGYLRLYWEVGDHHWLWLPVSLLAALVLQETYYYWFHRWMHIPSIFRLVHKWHHDSHIASPWTAFSFHPLEALIQAAFLPVILLFLPMNIWVLILLLIIMSVSSVINHLDIEVYPAWFARNPLTRMLIGATHHAMHHKQYKYNYGLYFTWWDKWLHTESPVYDELFREKTSQGSPVPDHFDGGSPVVPPRKV